MEHTPFPSNFRRGNINNGKLPGRLRVAAAAGLFPNKQSRLLYATDRLSGWRFLMDTGAEITDFLRAHNLIPDLVHGRLVDATDFTSNSRPATAAHAPHLGSVASAEDDYGRRLANSPKMVQLTFQAGHVQHGPCTPGPRLRIRLLGQHSHHQSNQTRTSSALASGVHSSGNF